MVNIISTKINNSVKDIKSIKIFLSSTCVIFFDMMTFAIGLETDNYHEQRQDRYMNIISIEDVAKSFNEKILFEKISLGITDSDRIGIVGINGAGKSTFLNMVSGNIEPDSGSIIRGNNLKIQYLSQDLKFNGNMTVLEQILQGGNLMMKTIRAYKGTMNRLEMAPDDKNLQKMLLEQSARMDELDAWTLESKAKSILSKLGISDINRKVGELSGGQRKRIALAEVLIQPADLLILDEPTNHIDLETIEWLEDYLSRQKGALLLVTHDRYFLDRVVNRIIEIDKGKLYSYNGSFEYYLEKKTLQKEVQTSMEKKRRRLYANELAWIRRGAKARTTKQKARIQRFEEIKKAGNKITGKQFEIPAAYTRLGKKVIEFDNVSKSFDSQTVIKDFSFLLGRRDRIGIVGPNGAGKTILLNLIAGLTAPDTGRVDIGKTVRSAYYRQNNENMDPSIRAIDYIRQTAEYVETGNGSMISAGQMLERFLFESSHQYNLIQSLSGGEKRRLYLAKVLIEKPNVLLLDEPTNDLDIQTLEVLEEYLEYFPGAVLVVSHDRYFLNKTTDRIIAVKSNGRIEFYNDLEAYGRSLSAAEPDQLEKSKPPGKYKDPVRANKKPKFTYAENREFTRIDEVIEKIESSLAEIEQEINDSWSDPSKMKELAVRQKELQARLAEKMERWAYLNELAEKIK